MTSLSTGMQRDWRHRGLIDAHDRHARFDVFGVSEIMVMRLFSEQGKGPKLTKSHAQKIAKAVVYTALVFSTKAWSASPREVLKERGIDRSDDDAILWLTKDFFTPHGDVRPVPHAIWWPTNEVTLGNFSELSQTSTAQGSETVEGDARFAGVALVLSLDTIAAKLVRGTPRAFVNILSDRPSPDNVPKRRVEGQHND